MFSCTHVVVRIVLVGIAVVGSYTCTGVYSTGFAGTHLGSSSTAGGASLSGRGAMAGGARGGFRLGSEESAAMRVRFDLKVMDNDNSHLLSSASSSSWLPPFCPTACLLDWAARPASRDGLICGLDCRNGSRNPWLTPFCGPDGLCIGGKGIECVVYHLSLPLPLDVVVRGRLGLLIHSNTVRQYIASATGFFQEAIATQIPLTQSVGYPASLPNRWIERICSMQRLRRL
jgi:hypothetical protein